MIYCTICNTRISNQLISDLTSILINEMVLFQKISQRLSDMVNYVEAVKFQGFPPPKPPKFYQMYSLPESQAEELVSDPETASQLIVHNSRQLTKVYPSQKRQDSSNLDPIPFWNTGCQIGEQQL